MFCRRIAVLVGAEMCARRRLQHVAEDTEETGREHARTNLHAVGQRHGGTRAGGSSWAPARGAGWRRPTRGLACATRGGGGGGLGCATAAGSAAPGTGALHVVGDVETAAVVLDVRLALALSDGVVGMSLDAAGEVGLADEVGQGVLVLGEIGGGSVLAETLVGQFLLWVVSLTAWRGGEGQMVTDGEWQGGYLRHRNRWLGRRRRRGSGSQCAHQCTRKLRGASVNRLGKCVRACVRARARRSRKLTSNLGIDGRYVDVGVVEGSGARGGGRLGDG